MLAVLIHLTDADKWINDIRAFISYRYLITVISMMRLDKGRKQYCRGTKARCYYFIKGIIVTSLPDVIFENYNVHD